MSIVKLPEPAHTLLIDQGAATYVPGISHPSQGSKPFCSYRTDSETIFIDERGVQRYPLTHCHLYTVQGTDAETGLPIAIDLVGASYEHAREEAEAELVEAITSIVRGEFLPNESD